MTSTLNQKGQDEVDCVRKEVFSPASTVTDPTGSDDMEYMEGDTISSQDEEYQSVNNKMADLALKEAEKEYLNDPPPYLDHLKEIYGDAQFLNIVTLLREVDRIKEKVDFNTSGLEEAIRRLNELIALVHEKKYAARQEQIADGSSSSQAPSSSPAAKNEESTIPYKDVDEAVTALSHDILLMQSTVEAHKMQNSRDKETYEKKLKDIQSKMALQRQRMRTDGKIYWRIPDFKETLELQKATLEPEKMSIISQHFQTASGHEFRLRAFLNGTGRGRGTHLSMFIQMCKTPFDDILEYPYQGVIAFRVFDQGNRAEKKHHKLMFKTNNSPCFKKPEADIEFTPENGLAQLLSHQEINKTPNEAIEAVYLKNNVLFVGAEILPPHPPSDLEMSKMFYGEWKAATLLEADCDLLAIEGVNITKQTDADESVDNISTDTNVEEILANI